MGAGAGVAAATGKKEIRLAPETKLSFKLSSPVTVSARRKAATQEAAGRLCRGGHRLIRYRPGGFPAVHWRVNRSRVGTTRSVFAALEGGVAGILLSTLTKPSAE